MKTDFSINVQVNIGVTPEVVQLFTSILQKTPPAEPSPAASEQHGKSAAQTRKGKEKPNTPLPDTQTVEAPPASNGETTDTPEAPAELAEPKELTEQDIREAMHRTRQRIEGEDYKNNTESDGYKQYHKQLTATFKNIAALLGSDKPSTLPADKRKLFIRQCEELVVEDGKITTEAPF